MSSLSVEPFHRHTMTILIPFRVLLPFSLQDEHICFCSSHFNGPDRPLHSGSWQHACSRLRQHGLLPSARSHHQQITLIPQPTAALLRLGSINRTMTSHLGTSSAAGCSTPLHFLFPVKKIHSQRQFKISTPTSRRHIFRKIVSPLK